MIEMLNKILFFVFMAVGVVIIVYGMQEFFREKASSGQPLPMGGIPVNIEPAALRARADLSLKMQAPEQFISILAVEPRQWPNACLGLNKGGEMCAEVITPGFQVALGLEGNTYIYRTNQDGSIVRAAF